MEMIKAVLMWSLSMALALVVTPWTIVMAIKLALWPQLLNDYEQSLIVTMQSEIDEEFVAVKTVRDIFAVVVISMFVPPWMALWLWIALVVSFVFMLEIKVLVMTDTVG